MEVYSSTEMGAPCASHSGTRDHGPKADRSRPRSVPVKAYLRFARERFALYSSIMDRVRETHGSSVAKSVWDLLLEAASGISGQPDDTAAAVATWSFLHGYAVLEHSGAFGASGPKGALERGLTAFLTSFPVKEHAR